MREVGNYTRIDSAYVKEYIAAWCKKHSSSCAGISRKILGRSDSFLSQVIRNGKMRNFDLKLLCDTTGLDIDKVIWIPPAESDKPSDTTENDGAARDIAPDYSARLERIETELKKTNDAQVSFGKILVDMMQTLHGMSEDVKNFLVANSKAHTRLLNQIKYGGK